VALVGGSGEVVGEIQERRVEETQQGAEGVFLARVGRCGYQDHVPRLVSREARDEAVALVAGAPALAGGALGAGVGLVHYHELRAGAQEVVSAPVGLNEVGGDDYVRVAVEDGLAGAEGTLQALRGAGEDLLGLNVELVPELGLPLAGELGWTEDGEAFGLSPIQ